VPLVSTKFADSPHWSFHYLTSIGVASVCIVCSSLVFRFKKQDGVHIYGVVRLYVADRALISDILEEIGQPPKERGADNQNHYRQIMSQRAVHMMAFFITVYVG
jgi:hypothetical protein